MEIKVIQTTENINWQEVNAILNSFGLTNHSVEETELVFKRSQEVVFLVRDSKVIGCGRALTDYIAQASIYNIAIVKEYHGQKLGQLIMKELIEKVKGCNISLYTHPDTVDWYQQQGFHLMKTGLIIYQGDHIEEMKEMGFI